MEHHFAEQPCDRSSGVLPREFHEILHRNVLVRPVNVSGIRIEESMLFQHRCDGNGYGEMESWELSPANRKLDGIAEEKEDLRLGFLAAVSTGVRR